MNTILKVSILTCLVVATTVIILLILVLTLLFSHTDSNLLGGKWRIEDLQQYFIGDLPKSATDLHYQPLQYYALLSFKASPSEALVFTNRFCYGMLLKGYDPFNSFDNEDATNGYLIQTDPDYFYYSHSINMLNTQWGIRCNDLERGGLQQIAVFTQDNTLYEVKLEISGTCINQNGPHTCQGIRIPYTNQGSMELGHSYHVIGRPAEGDSWNITLEPNRQYQLIVKSTDTLQAQTYGRIHISILPLVTIGNEPYCQACWVNANASSQSVSKITFFSPPWGETKIRVFWLDTDDTYEIIVIEND